MFSPTEEFVFNCPVRLVFFPFIFSINGKNKMLIVYNFCVSLKQRENEEKKKSYASTATFLVCITDVAQMMCMFYI